MTSVRVLTEVEVIRAEIHRKREEIARLSQRLGDLTGEAAAPANGNGSAATREPSLRLPAEAVEEDVIPLAELERRYVLRVLERFGGNRSQTARALQIGTNTLWRKLKAWGAPPARGR